MTIFGCDYSYSRPDVAAMARAGVRFACRYLRDGGKAGKALSPAEARRLRQAGIAIVSNDETTGVQYRGGFDGGRRDAHAALDAHLACGGPTDRPIYFTPLDHDPDGLTDYEWGTLRSYARGVVDVLGVARVGWYGGTRMLRDLRGRDLGRWWWQALGWREGVWLDWAHIHQYDNGNQRWGGEVDYDRALQADYGQWGLAATPTVQEDLTMATADDILAAITQLRNDLTAFGTKGLHDSVEVYASKIRDIQAKATSIAQGVGELSDDEANLLAAIAGIQQGMSDEQAATAAAEIATSLTATLPPAFVAALKEAL